MLVFNFLMVFTANIYTFFSINILIYVCEGSVRIFGGLQVHSPHAPTIIFIIVCTMHSTFFTHHHFCPNTAKYLWLALLPQIYLYRRIYVYSSDCGALVFCIDFTKRLYGKSYRNNTQKLINAIHSWWTKIYMLSEEAREKNNNTQSTLDKHLRVGSLYFCNEFSDNLFDLALSYIPHVAICLLFKGFRTSFEFFFG